MKPMKSTDGGNRGVIILVGVVVLSVFAGAVMAAGPADDLNFTADDPAPNPRIDTDLTVAKHPMSEGTSADAMAGYYDDSGDWVGDPVFVVNTTEDESVQSTMNKYTFDPAKIEDDDWTEFPRTDDESDNTASIMDGSEWTAETNSNNVTISETTLASGVDAVNFDFDSSGDTDTIAEVGYGNWSSSFDSDESKRVFSVGGKIEDMDSDGKVNISLHDESGDMKTVSIEPGASTQDANATVAYNDSSGTFFYQIKMNALPDDSNALDNIESVNVTALHRGSGAMSVDVSFSHIGFEKKSKWNLGDRAVDNADDDSDFDQRNSTYNATGTISIHDVGTLDSAFDDASLTDVQFPAHFRMQDLQGAEGEEETYVMETRNASAYPNFDTILNVTARMRLPGEIDLSYSTNDLKLEQQYPSGRYLELGNAEDIASTANLSQASWDDDTGSLGSVGDIIKMDDSVTSDQYHAVHYEVKLSSAEADDALGATTSSGGGAPPADSGGGGLGAFLMSPLGILTSLGAALLGGRWAGWF